LSDTYPLTSNDASVSFIGIIPYIYLLCVLFGLEMSVLLIITNFDGSNDRKFGRHSNLACNSCSLMNSHHVDQQAHA
jgi:hypothetical protein